MLTTSPLRFTFAGIFLIGMLAANSCSSSRKVERFLSKQLQYADQAEQFTGVLMVDASKGDTLFAWNEQRYFTPASNMKVFTLYAALKELPDRVPALKYMVRSDTLYFMGTGDPTALHPVLQDSTTLAFMAKFNHLEGYAGTLSEPAWGPGWAWDDFDRYYMVDRSSLPVFGNVIHLVRNQEGLQVSPTSFRDSVDFNMSQYRRDPEANRFHYHPGLPDTLQIPLAITPSLSLHLWEQALGKPIRVGEKWPTGSWSVLPGMPADSLYREMMTVSDNFLAEQIMLLVSSSLGDSLSFARARDHVLETHLANLPGPPRWVDGSGLSRYNLVTPESLVYLLMELYREFPEERLFALMAQGGKEGTLKDWYKDPDGPYLFGKTGSLSNNHNLCGYLRTKSGKTVVFSFMNNHYRKPTTLVKSRMQRLLKWVREHY